MKKIIFLLVTIAIIPFCYPGCSSGADLSFSCDDFTENQNINREITLSQGETVTVTLCSNASTGFTWDESATIQNTNMLKQTGHKFISSKKNMPGAAGQEEWTFKALEPGTSTAYLEYSQPWEGGEKGVWKFTLTVVVK